jgi:hypothetical protein
MKSFMTFAIASVAVAQHYWDESRSERQNGYFSSPTHEGS